MAQPDDSIETAVDALRSLAEDDPDLATSLADLVTVLASNSSTSKKLRNQLARVLAAPQEPSEPRSSPSASGRPKNRRDAAVLDPFEAYASGGEDGLRSRLGTLDLERLRDIVAEYAMDPDRLAMRWKDPQRVIDRIVERVVARRSKGSAFRG